MHYKYGTSLKNIADKVTNFRAGDRVIFSPDDIYISKNNDDFGGGEVYPGQIVTIEKLIRNDKYVELNPSSSPSVEQFIPYRETEKCAYTVGDIVKFTPSVRTKQYSSGRIGSFGLKINQDYPVRRIVNDVWIFVEDDIYGFYWKDFFLVKKSETDNLISDKTVEELVEDVLTVYKNSEKDGDVQFWEETLTDYLSDLKSKKEELIKSAFIRIQNGAIGGLGRMITLKLHPKKEIKTKEKEWNDRYNNIVYELYWAARKINDSIENLK